MARKKTLLLGSQILQRSSEGRRKFLFRTSNSSTVVATQLTFTTQPDGGVTGTNLTQQPVVKATNSSGQVDTSWVSNVTLTVKYGSGALSGTATVTAVAGVATFTNLKITGAGHHILAANGGVLTEGRSKYLTVNPTATAAETVLTFGGATSDKIDCGSGASLDNLTNGGGFFVVARVYCTTSGANEFIASKYNTGDAGWALGFDNGPGSLRIQANMGRATTGLLRVSDSSNTITVNTWYDVGFSWNGTNGRIWRAAVGSVLTEVGYEAGSTDGSGTVSTDAGANCWIGNLQISPTSVFKGQIAWVGIWNKVPTAQEMLQIQMGFDARDTARITAVTGCQGLWQCNATGTLTDASGNSNSGTVTGATTTTSSQVIYAPSVWGNADDATNVSNLYKKVRSHGTVAYVTTATSVDVGLYRNATLGATYDAQAAVAVFEGNTYKGQLLGTVSAGGYNYGTLALSAGSKTVIFENSLHTRTGTADTGVDAPGTNVVSIKFNASATEVIPPTPTTTWLSINDSVDEGFVTSPVGSSGPNNLLRAYLSAYTGSTAFYTWGYGGRPFYQLAVDATARTNSSVEVAKYNPDYILVNLGANDYISQSILWTPAAMQTGVAAWFVAVNALLPNARIYAVTPYTKASGEGANPTDTLQAYRDAITNAASGKSYVTVINGPTVWDGTNNTDGVHPNNTGATAVYNGLKTALGI